MKTLKPDTGERPKTVFNVLMAAVLIAGIDPAVHAQPLKTTNDSETIEVERCFKYVQSTRWFYRDYQWALAITPTPCARRTQPDTTAYLWDELNRDCAHSRYWKNSHGLRHQLICHLAIARDKPEWILEPWRPDVGYVGTLEAGCNPVTPLATPAP